MGQLSVREAARVFGRLDRHVKEVLVEASLLSSTTPETQALLEEIQRLLCDAEQATTELRVRSEE